MLKDTARRDWAAEAARIAASEAHAYGSPEEPEAPKAAGASSSGRASQAEPTDGAASYVMTGDKHWLSATADERSAVVSAFATNRCVRFVGLASAGVTDLLAQEWGTVLRSNDTIEVLHVDSIRYTRYMHCTRHMRCARHIRFTQVLNLESNTISSGGIEALAAALPLNTRLRELKLANQRQTYSQRAEEALATAL